VCAAGDGGTIDVIFSRKNQRDGNTYYFVRYDRPVGRPKQEKVPVTAAGRLPTKLDARDFLTKRKAEVLAGNWVDPDAPAARLPAMDRGPTFADFTERFSKGTSRKAPLESLSVERSRADQALW
jgi:hypothetical protein